MSRQLSNAAQVAKLCKKHLKSMGIKCKATSDNYSGDSVNIEIENIDPETFKNIQLEFSKYQKGSFDGMQDMYVLDNKRSDVPQTKHLFINNRLSGDLEDCIKVYIKKTFDVIDDKTARDKQNMWYSNFVHQTFSGALDKTCCFEGFWPKYKKFIKQK